MSEADSKIVDVEAGNEDTEEHGDEEKNSSTRHKAGEVTAQLLKNPEALAAIQDGLNSMVGRNSGYIKSLPPAVRRRIKALKKLQGEMTEIEAKFYEEFHALECKYSALYSPLFSKRSEIANGRVEPTDEECEWPSDEEDEDDEDNKLPGDADKDKSSTEKSNGEKEEQSKGIPEFWLTTFKSTSLIQEMIQEHDEPILRHLTDVQIEYVNNPAGFNILFHFDQNDYFTNQVLTKSYSLKFDPDPSDLLNYDGPEIVSCKGCTIDWKSGKNVTVKLIKKIQKHKGRGTKRTVTKTVPNDSFFNFFSPPEAPKDDEEESEDTENLLAVDYEIGHYLRERVIPRAVLYFTGEAEADDEYEEGEGEEEEDGSDDYNEDEDPDFVPADGKQNAADCKQQ